MRPTTLALTAIVSLVPSACAFAPIYTPTVGSTSTSLSLSESDNNSLDQAKKGLMSIFAASTIFIASSTVGSPAFVDPAFAATTAPPAPTTVTAKKAAPVDPLAAEKKAVEAAKAQLATASVEVGKTKKVLGEANTALAKATDATANADRKVLATKKALITANDKLADAKAKEGRNGGDLNALKEVESLATKVGMFLLLFLLN